MMEFMVPTDYFFNDAVDKQFTISYSGGSLKNDDIVEESMKLNEILCSENQLRFGSCNASRLELTIINMVAPLKDKCLTVSCDVEGSETGYQFGVYKVNSDKPTADRRYRDIVAYDAMYDILKADVSEWYNTILPDADSTVTLMEFRYSFFSYFGIEQEEVTLVNDSMIVTKTIEPSQLSGKTVVTAICEINGCFGHIGRNGKFQYIHLKEMVDGLYPADTLYPRDDLYPADPMNAERISKSHYISAEYEDYVTERITKLQIRQEENDIGCIYGTGDNCYIVQDNFLLYGKSTEELTDIAAKMYSVISKVWYRPAHVEAKGNPCLEVGDGIRLSTKYAIVYTYILQRTLKGIQALRDTYDADGEQFQSEKVNSVREEIIQLKGKTNKLVRTVEETRLEIKDIEAGLDSRITQTADKIETEVTRAKSAEESLGSRITQTADSISSEVTRATNAESDLSSKITQTAEKIELKVSIGEISSRLSVETGQVKISSNRFVLESTNCSISADGTIKANNVELSGKITATSGEIGGFVIGTDSIHTSAATTFGGVGVYLGRNGFSCNGTLGTTKISSDGSADFDTSNGIKVHSGLDTYGYTYVTKDGLKVKAGSYSESKYEGNGITFGTNATINSSSGNLEIKAYQKLILAGSTGSIGFFGSNGSSKKSITSISSTSSATASSCATKINEILTALKAYNLIG